MIYSSACIIKSPLDFVIDLLVTNEYNVTLPSAADNEATYAVGIIALRSIGNAAGVDRFLKWLVGTPITRSPPSMNSGSYIYLYRRNIFTDRMIADGITHNMQNVVIDPISFADQLPNPGDPKRAHYTIAGDIVSVSCPKAPGIIKRSILLSGQLQDYYWTNAWMRLRPTWPTWAPGRSY